MTTNRGKLDAWLALLAPAGTSSDVMRRLDAALKQSLATKELREAFAAQGVSPAPRSPEEFAVFIRNEVAKWSHVVKASGVKID